MNFEAAKAKIKAETGLILYMPDPLKSGKIPLMVILPGGRTLGLTVQENGTQVDLDLAVQLLIKGIKAA
jgi:hypothetical protein